MATTCGCSSADLRPRPAARFGALWTGGVGAEQKFSVKAEPRRHKVCAPLRTTGAFLVVVVVATLIAFAAVAKMEFKDGSGRR